MKGIRHSFKIKPAVIGLGPIIPYELSYINYGDVSASHKIICVHGLTRNAMDFDPLSKYLCTNYYQKDSDDDLHVSCLDLLGRGQSDWTNNYSLYKMSRYVQICDDWIGLLKSASLSNNDTIMNDQNKDKKMISWIGTSLGGLIGMYYASTYYPSIKHLILNDIGPFIPQEFINNVLFEFCHNNPTVNTLDDLQNVLKERYSDQYGPNMTDDDWKRLAIDGSYYDKKENGYRIAYDPNVCEGFFMDVSKNENTGLYNDYDMFDDIWKKIPTDVKILLIRGENSGLLSREVVDKMVKTKPHQLSVVEIENVGHTPQLKDIQEMDIIAEFIGLRKR